MCEKIPADINAGFSGKPVCFVGGHAWFAFVTEALSPRAIFASTCPDISPQCHHINLLMPVQGGFC